MARASLVPVALATLGLALLTGCADDDGEPTTAGAPPVEASGSLAADRVETACSGLEGTVLRLVGTEPPEDDGSFRDALALLEEEADEPLRSHAAAVIAADGVDAGMAIDDDDDDDVDAADVRDDLDEAQAVIDEGITGVTAVLDWALESCPVDHVVWGCIHTEGTETFHPVGESITGEGDSTTSTTTTTEPGASDPEAVYAEADRDGDPVEISRTDDEVVVAWLDDRGHAVETLTVVDDGGWRSDGGEQCVDPRASSGEEDDLEVVGEPIS